MLTQKGPVLGTWTGGTFLSHSWLACFRHQRHEVCVVGTVRRVPEQPPSPGRLMATVVPVSGSPALYH